MKILHMLQSNRFSGAENVIFQIISMMENANIEFVYCSRDGQIREALEERKIAFHPVEKMTVSEFRRVIQQENPDLIHAHDVSASILASIATLGTKIPVISHVHVNNSDMSRVNLKTLLYAAAARRFSHIFWVSKSCYDGFVFRKTVEKKSSLLYNVVNKAEIERRRDQDTNDYQFDVAYVGRLTQQKDPARLVEVLARFVQICPKAKIAIVGTGELEEFTREKIREKGLENNVVFCGFMKNPLKIMASSKVMVMTSEYEGLPMAVLEAMALGVPVVSTPVDGLKDVILNGYNGYLEDQNEKLVQRLERVVTDHTLQAELSNHAKEKFCEMNDLEKYREQVKQVYGVE